MRRFFNTLKAGKLFLALTLTSVIGFSQKPADTYISAELLLGYASGEKAGATQGISFSYGINKSRLTFRYLGSTHYLINFQKFPEVTVDGYPSEIRELSLLYGLQNIRSKSVYAFSAGPSYGFYYARNRINNEWTAIRSGAWGLSFEGAIRKVNFRPGKLRCGFGFKAFGTINKKGPFFGAGLTGSLDVKKVN